MHLVTNRNKDRLHAHTILSPGGECQPAPSLRTTHVHRGQKLGCMCLLYGAKHPFMCTTYSLLYTRRRASQAQPVVNPRTLSWPRGLDPERQEERTTAALLLWSGRL